MPIQITADLIISIAASYTEDELKALIKQQLDKLAENNRVTSASTGAGASYSAAQETDTESLLRLYMAALNYLQAGVIDISAGAMDVFPAKYAL